MGVVVAGTSGIVARYRDGQWEGSQPSALSFLAGDTDELDDPWPRAGTARVGVAYRRPSESRQGTLGAWPTPTARLGDGKRGPPSPRLARVRMEQGRRNLDDAVSLFWPTPTTQDAKNDGAPSQRERNMKPLNALVVTRPEGDEVDPIPSPTPLLNPVFVELLMGLDEGWTHV